MKLTTKHSAVTLSNNDFKGEGGEGQVFVKGQTAYKVYFDPKNSLDEKKHLELSVLDRDYILRPLDLLYKTDGTRVGYTMKYVDNTEALPRYFSTSFWQRNGITTTMPIVEKMVKGIEFVHSNNVLLVDINELNFLVDKEVYFIDVDSWQTKNYPAKVIMPSVRDWHTRGFNQNSDWFSFGVLACQLLLGIHPYKGKTKNAMTLEERMKANISIFDKSVHLPASVREMSLVPKEYQDWFTKVFQDGKRIAPPNVVSQGYTSKKQIVVKNLKLEEIQEFNDIQGVSYNNGWLVWTSQGVYHVISKSVKTYGHYDAIVFFAGEPVLVKMDNGMVTFTYRGKKLLSTYSAKKLWTYENKLFVIQEDKFFPIEFVKLGETLGVGAGPATQILPHATEQMRGCLYSNVLGVPHFFLPDGRIEKVKKGKIIDAKFDKVLKVQYLGDDPLDFVVLNNGLRITFNSDNLVLDNGVATKEIVDCGLWGNLVTDGLGLFCYDNNKLYKVSM